MTHRSIERPFPPLANGSESKGPPSVSECNWRVKRRPNVRFGSLADIGERIRDVRFALKSGHAQSRQRCRLRAKRSHSCDRRAYGRCICLHA